MKTLLQNKNRLLSGDKSIKSNKNKRLDSLLWHLVLHKSFSNEDCNLLEEYTPNSCALFIRSSNSVLYKSALFEAIENSDLNYAYDATFVQQVMTVDEGVLRVLTVPITGNILIGLITPSSMYQVQEIEDAFLHKINIVQNRFGEISNTVTEMQEIIKHTDPIIIVNRTDNQLLTCNVTALTFFNLTCETLLETNLQILQKNYPKALKRKIKIHNCVIGDTSCSLVQFSTIDSEISPEKTYAKQLECHAENLLQFFKNYPTDTISNEESFQASLTELEKCHREIQKLSRNEEEK